jgi:hypothetical protein
MAALAHIEARYPEASDGLGPRASFNPTFVVDGRVWVSPRHFAIDQGPVVLMVENHLSGLVWRSMRSCPYVVRGLERAGFAGGWMEDAVRSVQKLHRRG